MANSGHGVPVRTMAELGLVLRERRKALGWSQADLADRVGMSRKWVGEAEGGKPTLAVEAVLRALAAVGVVLDVPLMSPARTKLTSKPGTVNLGDILARARGDRRWTPSINAVWDSSAGGEPDKSGRKSRTGRKRR